MHSVSSSRPLGKQWLALFKTHQQAGILRRCQTLLMRHEELTAKITEIIGKEHHEWSANSSRDVWLTRKGAKNEEGKARSIIHLRRTDMFNHLIDIFPSNLPRDIWKGLVEKINRTEIRTWLQILWHAYLSGKVELEVHYRGVSLKGSCQNKLY